MRSSQESCDFSIQFEDVSPFNLDQIVFDLLPGGPNARLAKTRPCGQIGWLSGSVSLKVSSRKLRFRQLRTRLLAGANPIFEKNVSWLAVEVGAEADQSLEAGETQEVIGRLTFVWDSAAF